jgi:hypothetical protein
MSSQIPSKKPLNSITKDEWVTILREEAFRGHKINRIAKALKSPDSIAIATKTAFSELTYNPNKSKKKMVFDDGKHQYTLNLKKITKREASWSFARFTYWVAKNIFRMDQAPFEEKIDNLAEAIYKKLQITPLEAEMNQLMTAPTLSSAEIDNFLDNKGKEISQFAAKKPDDWLTFSKQIRMNLDPAQDNSQIADRLDKLDFIIAKHAGIDTHYYPPFTPDAVKKLPEVLTEDALSEVKTIAPAQLGKGGLNDFLELQKHMQFLQKTDPAPPGYPKVVNGIKAEVFAKWIDSIKLNLGRVKTMGLTDSDFQTLIPLLTHLNVVNYNPRNIFIHADHIFIHADRARSIELSYAGLMALDQLAHPDNIEEITLTGTFLTQRISELDKLPNLKRLILPSFTYPVDAKLMTQLGNLKALESITLADPQDTLTANTLLQLQKQG